MGAVRHAVIQGQNGWGVTYTSTEICASKGSTVEMSCTYTYPTTEYDVQETFWFTKASNNDYVDLKTDSEYSGRVQYICDNNKCTLRITDLRESDSAEYRFRFTTNLSSGKYAGSPGVTLSVTDLQVRASSYGWAECPSSYRLPDDASYIWYKNGQKVQAQTSSYIYLNTDDHENSYSCAVNRCEDLVSPPVCVRGQNCNRVTYTDRSICAFKGSSVDISCTYNSYDGSITSKFWFSPGRSDQWQSPSQPEDLSEDSLYAGRVQVFDTERGRSTLRITDLRESDSAQYHFKFKTPRFEWRSILPGTTLTVTALQVQVNTISVTQNNTEAELKCHSSCSPAGRLSYVWFKNGQKVREETSSYKGWFDPEDFISCALKGHENYGSPSVYAPKLPSVSVSLSGEIVENSSVTLTCSSDANPAAKYTWYKKNGDPDPRPLSKEAELVFRSIQSSDYGEYYCTAENELRRRTSESISIHVEYAPKLPSVSVSPSGEIVLGSSVTLNCSSDANPAAKYTWYKENEDLPKASGQIFTITDFRPEHSGNYYCEAQNRRGRHNSTLHLIVVAGSMKSVIVGSITAVVLAIIFLCAFLLIRRKKSLKQTTERPDNNAQLNMGTVSDNRSAAVQRTPAEEQDDLCYASVSYSKQQEEPLYSNVRPVQPNRHKNEEQEEEDEGSVAYSVINLKTGSASSESRRQNVVQDPSALYSMVKTPRV